MEQNVQKTLTSLPEVMLEQTNVVTSSGPIIPSSSPENPRHSQTSDAPGEEGTGKTDSYSC